MNEPVRILYKGEPGIVEVKKSRFIASICQVSSCEEAQIYIDSIKKRYWDARHNCFAFTVGDKQPILRFSDDGEPSGTAGKPMLDILTSEHLFNTAVVVTRYFGGVLLGTGGLVRAYSSAVKEAIANSTILERLEGIIYNLECQYTDLGKIQHFIAANNVPILKETFEAVPSLDIILPVNSWEQLYSSFTDVTSGRIKLEKSSSCYYALLDTASKKEVLLL